MTTRPPIPQIILDETTIEQDECRYRRNEYGDWFRLMYVGPYDSYLWYEIGNKGSVLPALLERIYQLESKNEFEVNT